MSTSDDPKTGRAVSRRTLLQGAAWLGSLGSWHAAVAASGVTAGALLSVPGKAVAEVTGCLVAFTHDGTGQACNPTYMNCSANLGGTSCGVQSGGTVACDTDSCVTMTGGYHCADASCTGSFTGDCQGLNSCHDQAGNCNNLTDCDSQDGNCNSLRNCDDLSGVCNGLGTCGSLDGTCNDQTGDCACHNEPSMGSLTAPKRFELPWLSSRDPMPYSRRLTAREEE